MANQPERVPVQLDLFPELLPQPKPEVDWHAVGVTVYRFSQVMDRIGRSVELVSRSLFGPIYQIEEGFRRAQKS